MQHSGKRALLQVLQTCCQLSIQNLNTFKKQNKKISILLCFGGIGIEWIASITQHMHSVSLLISLLLISGL